MGKTVNLDRAFNLDIEYPIGVDEEITFTNNDVNPLTDVFQILIAKKDGTLFKKIEETDPELSKADNVITWDVNFEHGEIDLETSYTWELRNKTQDWREFKGLFATTKTINHG